MRKFTPLTILGALAVISLIGCGGGGGAPSSTTDAGTKTVKFGDATLSYIGQAHTSTVTANNITTVNVAGATITQFQTIPQPVLANTTIAMGTATRGLLTYTNGVLSSIGGTTTGPVSFPSFTRNGSIAFASINKNVYTVNYDGSGAHQVTSTAHASDGVEWAPLNNQITYSDGSAIYLNNTSGSAETTLLNSAVNDHWPQISPNGANFICTNSSGTVSRIIGGPISSPSSTTVVSTVDNNLPCEVPTYSPDGKYIAYVVFPSSNSGNYIRIIDATTLASVFTIVPPSGHLYVYPTFAPDGKTIAFVDGSSLMSCSLSGDLMTTLVTLPNGADPVAPTWSPYYATRNWVFPTAAVFTTQISGLIYSQNGTAFASLLTFNCNTPSTAQILQETGPAGGAVVYEINGDLIQGCRYTNSYYGQIVVTSLSVPQMLVTVDSTTGQISTIAPLMVHAGQTVAPKKIVAGGLQYDRDFTAIYNAKGENIAPQGAKSVVFDAKTGVAVSFK